MIVRKLTDLLLPRHCIGCGERLISEEKHLCLKCLIQMPRTWLWLNPEENELAKNYWGRTGGIEVKKVVGYLSYIPDGMVSEIVKAFKYSGASKLAYDMGRMMARELKPYGMFDDIDAIVPVPITLMRRLSRGYNQAEWIAKGISKETGLPIFDKVLKRTKFGTSQTHLSGYERADNVMNAFALIDRNRQMVEGKHLLIVDDVITTSATTRACAKQFAGIPGIRVSILGFSTAQSKGFRVEPAKALKKDNEEEKEINTI